MNRRSFIKLSGVAAVVPSALSASTAAPTVPVIKATYADLMVKKMAETKARILNDLLKEVYLPSISRTAFTQTPFTELICSQPRRTSIINYE